jgi:hypothetical protein
VITSAVPEGTTVGRSTTRSADQTCVVASFGGDTAVERFAGGGGTITHLVRDSDTVHDNAARYVLHVPIRLFTTDAALSSDDLAWIRSKVATKVRLASLSIAYLGIAPTPYPGEDAIEVEDHASSRAGYTSALVELLRHRTALPATDVAQMIGVGRRQLYNLLDGRPTSPDTSRRIGQAQEIVGALVDALGDEGERVRNALLIPIAGKSLYDTLRDDDYETAHRLLPRVLRRIDAGARLPRQLPPSGRGSGGSYDDLFELKDEPRPRAS